MKQSELPGQTERSQVKALKWLVADIIELSVELLTPQQAKEVLFDQLKELGWNGQGEISGNIGSSERMSFDEFRTSMKSVSKNESIMNSAINSRLVNNTGTVNQESNDRIIVGGVTWGEIKERRKDPKWDRASFWKHLNTHD